MKITDQVWGVRRAAGSRPAAAASGTWNTSARAASGSCGSTSTRRAAWTSTTARPCPARSTRSLTKRTPIPESYRFEVCSAGLERQLKRPSDFERYLGEPVLVKLYRRATARRSSPAASCAMRTGQLRSRCAAARSRLTRRRSRSCGSAWSSNHEGEKS